LKWSRRSAEREEVALEGDRCSTTDEGPPVAAVAVEVAVILEAGGGGRDRDAASSDLRKERRRRKDSTWSRSNLELIFWTSSFSPASSLICSPFYRHKDAD